MSMPKSVVENFTKALWDEKNPNLIDEFVDINVQVVSPILEEVGKGSDDLKKVATSWHQAFPDAQTVKSEYICEGNKVVKLWQIKGTHTGEFLNISPTQKTINLSGVTVYDIQDSKIKSYQAIVDIAKLKAQLM